MIHSRMLVVLIFLFPVMAQAMTIDDLNVGKTILGPNLSVADMKGKVVYVEYWGTN